MPDIGKRFSPKEVEKNIYKLWEKSGYFNPDRLPRINADAIPHQSPAGEQVPYGAGELGAGQARKNVEKIQRESAPSQRKSVFSIVLPPPNVTGELHMGHAAMIAIEDIMVRYARMRGKKTLWVPGTDHAAIATQATVEKELYKKEGKNRHDLGRKKFLRMVEDYASRSHEYIVSQIKRMGASLDWSREAFTLDDQRSLAVRTAFKRMYEAGLIYRGERIVSWDPKMQTTVSDDEVEWLEEQSPFYYLKYGPFEIGTARPETKFGDKYVVTHPDDKRYKKYKHGEKLEVEWINGKITATVIKDKAVDMKFGTGAMTITPWHDNADFEIAERHKLDREQIIDQYGRLLPIAGEFAGMKIKGARPKIVEKLKEKGLLTRLDKKYTHRVATNSRGGGLIEPQVMRQWFVNVGFRFQVLGSRLKGIKNGQKVSLKDLMKQAVKSGEIEIIPERFKKIYFHWIDNLRDWCISRQIWYGHRIPVWYKGEKVYCGVEEPKEQGWEQDPDTLDTWFSSGLWSFSTLRWPFDYVQGKPKKGSDLATFHPMSILETGYDILFFWVARMILMSTYLLGEVPFKKVYLHGLVRDEKGRKMSKSLGNGIDPLEMADRYGADAARMSLIIGTGPGNDVKLSEDKIRGYRNFATKIWNASRFVLMNKPPLINADRPFDSARGKRGSTPIKHDARRKKYLAELKKVKGRVAKHIEKFEFHLAGEKAYHYFWHTFADKIIEEEKKHFHGDDEKEKQTAYRVLETILIECLKMLHPFMPFVTEEIYQKLKPGKMLMVEPW